MEQPIVESDSKVKKICNMYEFATASKESLKRPLQTSVKKAERFYVNGDFHHTKKNYKQAYSDYLKAYNLLKPKLTAGILADNLFYAIICTQLSVVLDEFNKQEFKNISLLNENLEKGLLSTEESTAKIRKHLLNAKAYLIEAFSYMDEINPLVVKLNCYEQQRYFFMMARLFGAQAKYHRELLAFEYDKENQLNSRKYYIKTLNLTPSDTPYAENVIQSCFSDISYKYFTGELGNLRKNIDVVL